MNSEALFTAAHSTAINLLESGAFITPTDTVCSIESASGRIFTGISRTDVNALLHAELDAVRNMQAAGENIIRVIFLINTNTREPLLPCNKCLDLILSLAPENSECMIMMQDRMIDIKEVGMFAAPMTGGNDMQNFTGTSLPQNKQYTTHASAAPVNTAAAAETGTIHAKPSASVSLAEILEVSAEVEANNKNSNGGILKNKIKDILKTADDDTDEFLDSLPSPKRRSGLFRK